MPEIERDCDGEDVSRYHRKIELSDVGRRNGYFLSSFWLIDQIAELRDSTGDYPAFEAEREACDLYMYLLLHS